MNIFEICDYLNKKSGIAVNKSYYANISQWADWYRGYYKPFHHYTDYNGKETISLDRYSLKMAKKVCEDWANMLLNEKTYITASTPRADRILKNVFSENNFFENANDLIEKTFALGTGAAVIRLVGGKIKFEFITADRIIPISYSNGEITEVAFASSHTVKGKTYTYIETHLKNKEGNYVISNEYLDEDFRPAKINPGVERKFETGSKVPWFAVFKPAITNNIDMDSPMGISVYANAIDVLKGVDLAYDNLCTDFFLGGKMVLMNENIISEDKNGRRQPPQFSRKRLFMSMGDSFIDGKMYEEYNPKLRVDENVKGIQSQLNYLATKCGFGERYYSYEFYREFTATEIINDNATLFRNVKKHENLIEAGLKALAKAVLSISGFTDDTSVEIIFDDSIVENKKDQREQDRADIKDGLMKKWEYRMKYYGETEKKAKEMAGE